MLISDLQRGDVLAYRATASMLTFLGLAFGQWLAGEEWGGYVHVGIWTGVGEASAYTDSGVMIGGKFPYPCDVLRPRSSPAQIEKGFAWIESRIGRTPYDWFGLGWVWLMRRLKLKKYRDWPTDRLICSAFVARYLERCGLTPWPGLFTCEILPSDFEALFDLPRVGQVA